MDKHETTACQIIKTNQNSFLLRKHVQGKHSFIWLGQRGLEDGVYKISFSIRATKQIPVKHDCGIKIHHPKQKMYNNFLSGLKVNEFNFVEQYVHITADDLCCIIFDSFEESIEIEIKDLRFYNMKNDVTIILQGVINPKVDQIRTIKHYLHFGKIVVSSYFKDTPTYYWNIDRNNIHFIMNDLVCMTNELKRSGNFRNNSWSDNCYYQLKTTERALNDTHTLFAIKTRVDSYFSNIGDMIEIMLNNQNKVLTLSVFLRGALHTRNHMSDILFGAKTDVIKNIIKMAIEKYPVDRCPEVNVWDSYIKQCIGHKYLEPEDYVREMVKHFIVYPINWNEEYSIRGMTRLKDTPKSTEEYMRHGCEC